MGAITILTITTLIFSIFSLIVIFFSLKDKLNEIKKENGIVLIFLEVVCLSLINNIKLIDGINNYKKNKFHIEKKELRKSNNAVKEEILSLPTEFEDNETLFKDSKKDTYYYKKTLVNENKENNEIKEYFTKKTIY